MIEFKLDRLSDYSDDAILEEILRVADILKERPLTISNFDKESRVNHTTITRRFGNWKNALQKAGLDNSYFHTQNIKKNKEEIILELQRVAKVLGKDSFTAGEFEKASEMSRTSSALYREFGSFKKMMEAAGLISPAVSKRYSDEERYENLLNVWTYYGRQPSHAEMKSTPSIIGPKAYITRWGSWSKALYAFVERVNKDLCEQENTNIIEQKEAPSKKQTSISEEDSREIKLGLRYKILSRDHFKCKRCGDSPATNPACKLHVDHIAPFSKGGKTTANNLQTLCDKCNIGKGNRYAE